VVERVVDGDTVIAEVAGARERIRLLRIDAPEAARDGEPAECLADHATAALERLLPPGAEADLALDVERRDRFGRLLAHVWVDDTWVNGVLLEAGLVQVLTIPPNVGYDDEVRAAATRAREAGVGLWDPAAC
jgi:micrococcal nuclease